MLLAADTEEILCICLSPSCYPSRIRVLLCKALLYEMLPVSQTICQDPEKPLGI